PARSRTSRRRIGHGARAGARRLGARCIAPLHRGLPARRGGTLYGAHRRGDVPGTARDLPHRKGRVRAALRGRAPTRLGRDSPSRAPPKSEQRMTTKAAPPGALELWPGAPYPSGAHWDGEGINFAIYSRHAEKVELCLFEDTGRREIAR